MVLSLPDLILFHLLLVLKLKPCLVFRSRPPRPLCFLAIVFISVSAIYTAPPSATNIGVRRLRGRACTPKQRSLRPIAVVVFLNISRCSHLLGLAGPSPVLPPAVTT